MLVYYDVVDSLCICSLNKSVYFHGHYGAGYVYCYIVM